MKTVSIGSVFVHLHGVSLESRPDCESRYRDARVERERKKCRLAQWFYPVVRPGRDLPTVNPGTGATIGETVLGTGATPSGVIIEN